MDLNGIILVGTAIRKIFELGVEPIEDDIIELAQELYAKLKETGAYELSQKWFVWGAATEKNENGELFIMNEAERLVLLEGAASIQRYCDTSENEFENYEEKLYYVAKRLPSVFSAGTKYGKDAK